MKLLEDRIKLLPAGILEDAQKSYKSWKPIGPNSIQTLKENYLNDQIIHFLG